MSDSNSISSCVHLCVCVCVCVSSIWMRLCANKKKILSINAVIWVFVYVMVRIICPHCIHIMTAWEQFQRLFLSFFFDRCSLYFGASSVSFFSSLLSVLFLFWGCFFLYCFVFLKSHVLFASILLIVCWNPKNAFSWFIFFFHLHFSNSFFLHLDTNWICSW